MEPNAKLDLALEFYYNSFYDESRKTEYENISDIFILHPEIYKHTSKNESHLIVEKLQKDGHINVKKSDPDWHKINYNGMMFHLQDGYTGQLKDLKSKRFKARLAQGIVNLAALTGILFALWEFCKEICSLVSCS